MSRGVRRLTGVGVAEARSTSQVTFVDAPIVEVLQIASASGGLSIRSCRPPLASALTAGSDGNSRPTPNHGSATDPTATVDLRSGLRPVNRDRLGGPRLC